MSKPARDDGTEVVKIRISSKTKKVLQKQAEGEYRTFAEQCRKVLDEHVEAEA